MGFLLPLSAVIELGQVLHSHVHTSLSDAQVAVLVGARVD